MNGAQYDTQEGPVREEGHQPPGGGPPPAPTSVPSRARSYKSPALATVLSLMPGMGQVYLGWYQQGFINALVVASLITLLSSNISDGIKPFAGLFLAFFWIYNMIDANRRATHFNRVQDGLAGEIPPEDFKDPGAGGSIVGGIILIALGVLFFLDLKFGISMEWIEDWWPLGLVGIGAYLVAKAVRKQD